jgi:multiple sugar transport system permease protein
MKSTELVGMRRAVSPLGAVPMTVNTGLRMFQTRDEGHLEWTMAMTVLSVVPLIVVFFMAQRRFVQGIVISGIKG